MAFSLIKMQSAEKRAIRYSIKNFFSNFMGKLTGDVKLKGMF